MGRQIPPDVQLEFHGVVTAGNPARRPPNTAAKCENFRIMPGYWLRLAGGRKARIFSALGSEFQQFHEFRNPYFIGFTHHFTQHKTSGTVKWKWVGLTGYWSLLDLETITLTYDASFAISNPVAVANLRDKGYFYNGLGVRDGSNSRPPFSMYDGSLLRYVGLDAYCPSGLNPTAAWANDSGSVAIRDSRQFWVGLHNASTGHYSNGVYCGTIPATSGADGTVTISNLARLTSASHGAGETGELKYVFYVTLDGGQIPYLVMDSTGLEPYSVAASVSSATLSFAGYASEGGIRVDVTKEMPTDNHPPRPMRSITYVNGRVYGVLLQGGSGSEIAQRKPDGTTRADFRYQPENRELAGVVWSKAANDVLDADLLGNPEECFPLDHLSATPTFEVPLLVKPHPDGRSVFVGTPTATFRLEEAADGLHEWTDISRIHGIAKIMTYAKTPYGDVWLSQRNQIMRLAADGSLEVLSYLYQSLLTGKVATYGEYILDPINELDQYRVYFTDGTSVIHDFAIGGEGSSATGTDYSAGGTLIDSGGVRHYVAAKRHLYTQEAQPEDGLVYTRNEEYVEGGLTITTSEINGEYQRQRDDFGHSDIRKEFPHLDLLADGAHSYQLNASPLVVEWYADFAELSAGNKRTAAVAKRPQSEEDYEYRAKLAEGQKFWYKLVFKMNGHAQDDGTFLKHQPPSTQGDLALNFYGSILMAKLTAASQGANRP